MEQNNGKTRFIADVLAYLFESIPSRYERESKRESFFGASAAIRAMVVIKIGDFKNDYGISRSTRNRAMRELEAAGLLFATGRQWMTTRRFVGKVLRIHNGYSEKYYVDDKAYYRKHQEEYNRKQAERKCYIIRANTGDVVGVTYHR